MTVVARNFVLPRPKREVCTVQHNQLVNPQAVSGDVGCCILCFHLA